MGEIIVSVKRVTEIMTQINAATAEQSAGIEQVNIAITEMDTVTQQNAALVEEAAAAAQALSEQTSALTALVSVFKTGNKVASTDVRVINNVNLVSKQSELLAL